MYRWATLMSSALAMGYKSEFASYAQWEMGGAPSELVFEDPKTRTTVIIKMTEGCVQGVNISGSAVNVLQGVQEWDASSRSWSRRIRGRNLYV